MPSCTSDQHPPHHSLPCDLPAAAPIHPAPQVSTGEVALSPRVLPQPTAPALGCNSDIWCHRFIQGEKLNIVSFPPLFFLVSSRQRWLLETLALCREPGGQPESGTESERVGQVEREGERERESEGEGEGESDVASCEEGKCLFKV